MKYTQGEWYASEPKISEVADGQTYFSIQSKNPEIRYGNYVMPGFYYPDSAQTLEEMQANAKLITASPQLLEVCKYAYAMLHQDLNDQFAPLVNELRKAINKATL